MIIFKNGSWQTLSTCPDTNWLQDVEGAEQPAYVIHDDSPLAEKIRANPCFTPITDSEGNLIDIDPIVYPEDETAKRRAEIMARLDELDKAEIRSIAAIAAGTATDEDRAKLTEYEAEKAALRSELAELGA